MSTITIQKNSIVRPKVDAIVNAANEQLAQGGGVCGAIFNAAGAAQLTKACNAIGKCKTGNAVITPGFNLPSKFVIHAVGPIWHGGDQNEPKLLYSAYKQSLLIAKENDCHSIAFPLISAGIFGYPHDKAWLKGLQACHDFIKNYPDYDIDIYFVGIDEDLLNLGREILVSLENEGKTDDSIDPELDKKCRAFCEKYVLVMKLLFEDEELRRWCHNFSVYGSVKEHHAIEKLIYDDFMMQAYDDGIVITDYNSVIENSKLDENLVNKPEKDWVASLSKEQIIACIAYHFRKDHFDNGSLMRYSIGEGHMLTLIQGYLDKIVKNDT